MLERQPRRLVRPRAAKLDLRHVVWIPVGGVPTELRACRWFPCLHPSDLEAAFDDSSIRTGLELDADARERRCELFEENIEDHLWVGVDLERDADGAVLHSVMISSRA